MTAYRFVHAADVHLDSPLRSLALRDPRLAEFVGNASRQVFSRIVDLCLDEQVSALLLAGDLYDGEQTSMKTARFLAEQLRRLDAADIEVFIIRGNHDALSKITKELVLPENVHLFGGRADAVEVSRDRGERPIAIHGLSFARPQAPESLLAKYRPPVAGVHYVATLNVGLKRDRTALAVAHLRPHYAPDAESYPLRQRIAALREPWQFLALFIVTIGGIYAGVFSPTEAASVGAFGAIVLGVLGRRLSLADLVRAIESSVVVSCLLFVIVIGANLFSFFIVQTHLPELLLDGARAWNLSGLMVMVLIILGYILLGCFLEGIGMVLITVPVFQPIVTQFGYDPIWFAIIVVVMVEVGLIHPPVGMNLFVIQAQAPDVKITSIYRGIIPFLIAPLILIILMFLFPGLALWLPKALYG